MLPEGIKRHKGERIVDVFEGFLTTVIAALTTGLPSVILTALICLVVAKYLLAFIGKAIDKAHMEATMARFLKPALRIIVYFFVILIVAEKLGVNTSSIVAFASVLSAAFALAAQNTLSNLFGGVLMLWTKPFVVGDYVAAGSVEGTVQAISLFYTVLVTADNKRVTIPNGTMSGDTITNYSAEGTRRIDLEIGVSYDAPVELAKQALMEGVNATDRILAEPAPPLVRVVRFGDSAVTYAIRVWIKSSDYWDTYFDLMENIKSSLDRSGVVIPYNQMVIHQAKAFTGPDN